MLGYGKAGKRVEIEMDIALILCIEYRLTPY